MNSFNHYAYGAIGEWMYRAMVGIEADETAPGFKRAVIRPRLGGNLTYLEGTHHSIYGYISVGWEVKENQVILTVRIPANTKAVIRLDEAKQVLEGDGLKFEQQQDYLEAEAGSGVYKLVYVK